MAEGCTCLLLKLRGSDFPQKDNSYAEGFKADPFYTLRSQYSPPGDGYAGEHKDKAPYKSKKCKQDLDPQWRYMAIDLQRLCNMNLDQKLLLDVYDWDRFSEPDFMSYIEVTPRQLIDAQGSHTGFTLRPPPPPHKQEVGELWVDAAKLEYPTVHISAQGGVTDIDWTKLKKVTKFAGQLKTSFESPPAESDIRVTNDTKIPLKIWITDDFDAYRAAQVGKAMGEKAAWLDLDVGDSDVYPRPDASKETYVLFLSPNQRPIVLAKWQFGIHLEGVPTTPIRVKFNLDDSHFQSFPVSSSDDQDQGKEEEVDQKKPKGFKVAMALKLRGSGLPNMDAGGFLSGKSDPYYMLRPAFGKPGGLPYVSPNKDSRGKDLPKKNYSGKHKTDAFLRSEVVDDELNPAWQTNLLGLNELLDASGYEGCVIDLNKKVLIDVWDYDPGGDHTDDFMCYCEASLQELVDAAKTGAPLDLIPDPSLQDGGKLYVDKVEVGFPEVHVRACPDKGDGEGLNVRNCCALTLQVLIANDLATFQRAEIGQVLSEADLSRTIMISGMRGSKASSTRINHTWLKGNGGIMLVILNESHLVVGKKTIPSRGTRELYMDLENGSWAMSSQTLKRQLQAYYDSAVDRIGNVSAPEVTLGDEDIAFFLEQREHIASMSLLLPAFGLGPKDCMDYNSFGAFMNRQALLVQQAFSKCDLVAGEGNQVQIMCDLLKKLHMIDTKCGLPKGEIYKQTLDILTSILTSAHSSTLAALKEGRWAHVEKALGSLKAAANSELVRHLADAGLLSGIFSSLVGEVEDHFTALRDEVLQHVPTLDALECLSQVPFSVTDAEKLKMSWEDLYLACTTEGLDQYVSRDLVSMKAEAETALKSYFNSLMMGIDTVLATSPMRSKLGDCKNVLLEAMALSLLSGLEFDPSQLALAFMKVEQTLSDTSAQIEEGLRKVAVVSKSCSLQQNACSPSLQDIPEMCRALVEAEEWTVDRAIYLQHTRMLDTLQGVIKEVMGILVEAAVVGDKQDILVKVIYIASEMQTMTSIMDSPTVCERLLSPVDIDITGAVKKVEDVIKACSECLIQCIKVQFPFHCKTKCDVPDAAVVDFYEVESLLLCIDTLGAYARSAGKASDYEHLNIMVSENIQKVLVSLKEEVDDVLADGQVHAHEVERMSIAMHTALRLHDEHERLYGMGSVGDFVSTAKKNLIICYDHLKSDLMLATNDTCKIEALLQVVSPLCGLDQCLGDVSSNFSALYHEYEGILRETMEENTKQILDLIQDSQFTEVAMIMEQHGTKGSAPWQIKAELSKKIEADLDEVLTKVKGISSDLPIGEIDDLHKSYKALKKASSIIDIVSDDVRKDFERFMDPDTGEIRKKLTRKVQAVQGELDRLLSTEQLGKAAMVVSNLCQASDSLQQVVGDAALDLESDATNKLKDAVNHSMAKMRDLPIEQWQYTSPSEFFELFEGNGPQASLLQAFKGELESVREALEQKVEAKFATSFLCAGSEDSELLERALQAFPTGRSREAVIGQFEQLKKAAAGEFDQVITATQNRDVISVVEIITNANAAARKQLFETLQAEAVKIKREWTKALEKDPANVELDGDFVQSWEFIAELKDFSCEEALSFLTDLLKIKEEMKDALITAEHLAASSFSCHLDNSIADCRFRDEFVAFRFLKRLVQLKVQEGSRSLGLAIFPTDLGRLTREVLRDFIMDFKKETKRLVRLLHTQEPEKAFDVYQIAKCLKSLKTRAELYTETKFTLDMLDSVMGADAWSDAKDKLAGKDLGSVMAIQVEDRKALEWDPEIWDDIEKKLEQWVEEWFNEAPDLQAKIKISSDRVLFFQLVGRRLAADASASLSLLVPFVGNSRAKAFLEANGHFQAKVLTASEQLWERLEQACNTLTNKEVDIAPFSQAEYQNKSDKKFLDDKDLMSEINRLYDAAKLFKLHVAPSLAEEFVCERMDLRSLSDVLLERVNKLAAQISTLDLSDLDSISGLLMTMHSQSEELLFQSADVKAVVSAALENFVKGASAAAQAAADAGEDKKNDMGISKLGLRLRDGRFRPGGEAVVRGYDAFQGYLTAIFNRKTEAQDISYVIQNIKVSEGSTLDTGRINSTFQKFDDRYKMEIKKCLDEGLGNAYLVPIIQKIVSSLNIRHAPANMMWTNEMKSQIPDLVALIFAVWTLHHSKRFLESMDASDKTAYLFQPHPVQAVAIFCLLGVDLGINGLERSLIQVRTGEGKSAVLGVSSSVFALFKCRVNVACYSEYLSQRDGEAIAFLFKALGIYEDVKYMTLTQVCEAEINKTVNIREVLGGMILGTEASGQAMQGEYKPRVLLVDEVDVFFTKSFYGSCYRPACELRDPAISTLLREIYDKSPADVNVVKDWPSYHDVCKKMKSWDFIVENAVSDMIAGLSCLSEHQSEYVVKDDLIGYREQDSISFNVSYGYLTILAYLKENRSGNISERSLQQALKLLVQCGEFLFAKSPQDFDVVMGVTGTLETMSPAERKIVKEDYYIKRLVYMPSVYGKNQVVERLISVEETEDDYVSTIIDEIEAAKASRAVIIFFDDLRELRKFAKLDKFSSHADGANFLLEEIYPEDKNQIVTCRAAQMNAVTLASSTFGRGTDFKCFDDQVQQAGGIHIIQTHVAETLSEEIQIKGRTARQGEKGSWSMVLRKGDLLKTYGIDENEISHLMAAGRSMDTNKAIWALINGKRSELNMAQLQELIAFVARNEKTHKAAVDFSKALLVRNINYVRDYIKNCNNPPTSDEKVRILVLMDATGSMGQPLCMAKDMIGEMFGRASEILNEHLAGAADKFEMQFAVFRNYSSGPASLLESSAWRSNPEDLKEFLKKTQASGGQGNEALEIGFWHANQQAHLRRVIVIGDADYNTQDDVINKRKKYGEGRYRGTKYEKPTFAEVEMKQLKEKEIPIDTFYINYRCQQCFEKMAAYTGGKVFPLSMTKPEGRETLIGHLTTTILKLVGGGGKGDDLVAAYNKKFGKLHS